MIGPAGFMAGPKQRDVFRDSPAEQAKVWRIAAETSRRQFPHDEKRAREYESVAEKYELQAKEPTHETL